MLMKDDKKKAATLIISALKPAPSKVAEKDGAEQEMNDHSIAADEILLAIEKKDVNALAEALKSFIQMCEYSEDEAEMEEGD